MPFTAIVGVPTSLPTLSMPSWWLLRARRRIRSRPRLPPVRGQTQLVERLGDHLEHVRDALIVDPRAQSGVEGFRISAPLSRAAASATRSGPQPDCSLSRYSAETSVSSLENGQAHDVEVDLDIADLLHFRIQRDVIQQKGQSGSNQKSACCRTAAAPQHFPRPSSSGWKSQGLLSSVRAAGRSGRRIIDRLYKQNGKALSIYSRSSAGYCPTWPVFYPDGTQPGSRSWIPPTSGPVSQQNPSAPDPYHNRIPQRRVPASDFLQELCVTAGAVDVE